jgi:hypothetical protein
VQCLEFRWLSLIEHAVQSRIEQRTRAFDFRETCGLGRCVFGQEVWNLTGTVIRESISGGFLGREPGNSGLYNFLGKA